MAAARKRCRARARPPHGVQGRHIPATAHLPGERSAGRRMSAMGPWSYRQGGRCAIALVSSASPTSARGGLDVVREQRVLIAHVEAPVADHRVRPARKPLVGNVEAALLAIAGRRRFGESDDVGLTLNVEVAVRVRDRTFADAAIPPHHVARRELEAGQDGIAEPVEVTVRPARRRRGGSSCSA